MTLKQALEILDNDILPDGSIYNLGRYISWNIGEKYITLDDKFDIEYLEALVTYIKSINK